MYKINDIVVYENGGICEVADIGIPEFMNTEEEYYKLKAVGPKDNTIYVKVKNERTMRYTISRDEAENYIHQVEDIDAIYNENSKAREKEFCDIIKERDWISCLKMYKGLMMAKSKRLSQGKQLNANDDRYFNRIDKIICDEFAVAMKLTATQVRELLCNACTAEYSI